MTVVKQWLADWHYYRDSRRWFKVGRCRVCGKWSMYILRAEQAHEQCWLEEK